MESLRAINTQRKSLKEAVKYIMCILRGLSMFDVFNYFSFHLFQLQ